MHKKGHWHVGRLEQIKNTRNLRHWIISYNYDCNFKGIKKNLLIFNTNHNISHNPIYVIRAEEYPGGKRDKPNPVILAYNGSAYESLDTCTSEDDTKAIKLVETVRKGEYNLKHSDIKQMTRIQRGKKDISISIESTTTAKVTKRGNNNTMNHTCKGCNKKFTTNMDLTNHRRQFHKQNTCPHCKKIKNMGGHST